jgi:hypothetical protein
MGLFFHFECFIFRSILLVWIVLNWRKLSVTTMFWAEQKLPLLCNCDVCYENDDASISSTIGTFLQESSSASWYGAASFRHSTYDN